MVEATREALRLQAGILAVHGCEVQLEHNKAVNFKSYEGRCIE
jgi:hypothetical protein